MQILDIVIDIYIRLFVLVEVDQYLRRRRPTEGDVIRVAFRIVSYHGQLAQRVTVRPPLVLVHGEERVQHLLHHPAGEFQYLLVTVNPFVGQPVQLGLPRDGLVPRLQVDADEDGGGRGGGQTGEFRPAYGDLVNSVDYQRSDRLFQVAEVRQRPRVNRRQSAGEVDDEVRVPFGPLHEFVAALARAEQVHVVPVQHAHVQSSAHDFPVGQMVHVRDRAQPFHPQPFHPTRMLQIDRLRQHSWTLVRETLGVCRWKESLRILHELVHVAWTDPVQVFPELNRPSTIGYRVAPRHRVLAVQAHGAIRLETGALPAPELVRGHAHVSQTVDLLVVAFAEILPDPEVYRAHALLGTGPHVPHAPGRVQLDHVLIETSQPAAIIGLIDPPHVVKVGQKSAGKRGRFRHHVVVPDPRQAFDGEG